MIVPNPRLTWRFTDTFRRRQLLDVVQTREGMCSQILWSSPCIPVVVYTYYCMSFVSHMIL